MSIDLDGIGQMRFQRDTLIAGKMYEWWALPDGRLTLRPSALRDPAFVDRLRTIVDEEAFRRIGVKEFQ